MKAADFLKYVWHFNGHQALKYYALKSDLKKCWPTGFRCLSSGNEKDKNVDP